MLNNGEQKVSKNKKNIDKVVVEGFGDEWSRFSQGEEEISEELEEIFENQYFSIFPFDKLPKNAVGADIGCGSGRWAKFAVKKVGHIHLIDASKSALNVAKNNLKSSSNVSFHLASVDDLPLQDASLDFAYSLGVLHHVPDTGKAIISIADKLKPGAPFLLYLYYAFDNKPGWYKRIWQASELFRRIISKSPKRFKTIICDVIALLVYWPLARLARQLDRFGLLPNAWPLSAYRNLSFYTMRTDALDRFGTQLEQRFSRNEISKMMDEAGLELIEFSDSIPYWVAVGYKK